MQLFSIEGKFLGQFSDLPLTLLTALWVVMEASKSCTERMLVRDHPICLPIEPLGG